ncbi:MAG: exonuclease domain-containing protein, partial [Gammaproteobacteria bacterium]
PMQLNWLDNQAVVLSTGFPSKMVLLDCETTGGNATRHRIIEIGLLLVEDGELIETWQSFVDPETTLPEMIQQLTGISPLMLRGAPRFAEIADKLLTCLEGRTLVAHNARFDYGFLKNEFRRAGIAYKARPLCSVKFSRSLFPQFKRHGLSQIIQRFQLPIENRHRALDDAEMIYRFFMKSSALFADDEIRAVCKNLLERPALPVLLDAKEIDKLPASAGVYYFYDQAGTLLYVGKSVHIRNRVMSHFTQDHRNPKDLRLGARVAHIDFEMTPTDFGAQIHESNQIKSLQPLYNHRLRKVKKLFQYRTRLDQSGYQHLYIEPVELDIDPADGQFGLFRSPRQATRVLEKLADQFFLCHKFLGLESDMASNRERPCFRRQLKKCFGACQGAEDAQTYNQRMTAALKGYQIRMWPWPGAIMVEERDLREPERVAFHIVNQWRYIAKLSLAEDIYDYGYQPADAGALTWNPGKQDAGMAVQNMPGSAASDDRFDLDIYFILVRFLLHADKLQTSNIKIRALLENANAFSTDTL